MLQLLTKRRQFGRLLRAIPRIVPLAEQAFEKKLNTQGQRGGSIVAGRAGADRVEIVLVVVEHPAVGRALFVMAVEPRPIHSGEPPPILEAVGHPAAEVVGEGLGLQLAQAGRIEEAAQVRADVRAAKQAIAREAIAIRFAELRAQNEFDPCRRARDADEIDARLVVVRSPARVLDQGRACVVALALAEGQTQAQQFDGVARGIVRVGTANVRTGIVRGDQLVAVLVTANHRIDLGGRLGVDFRPVDLETLGKDKSAADAAGSSSPTSTCSSTSTGEAGLRRFSWNRPPARARPPRPSAASG